MSIESGSGDWAQMVEAIDAATETMEEGIFNVRFSDAETLLVGNLLNEFWEAAFEAGNQYGYRRGFTGVI